MQNPSIPKAEQVRLHHMLDSARDAVDFATNRSRADLDTDHMLTLSLIKCVEIIGETPTQVSREWQAQLPNITWADIIGMRNRLIHAYYDVNHDMLWQTIHNDLPDLIPAIESLLQPKSESDKE